MTIKIISNYHWRELLSYYELSDMERALADDYHDWVSDPGDHLYFVYKGHVYILADFMRIEHHPDGDFSSWHGYASDSFFSGTLVRLSDCGDSVQVGRYLS